jgi:hypothetical protein
VCNSKPEKNPKPKPFSGSISLQNAILQKSKKKVNPKEENANFVVSASIHKSQAQRTEG